MRVLVKLLLASLVISDPVSVVTTLGPIIGQTEVSKFGPTINVFRAIPFAADAGGENRFRPPQPRTPWTSPLDCTQNGPGCRQPHHNPDVPCGGQEGPRCQSEDCLNLDVYCPSKPAPTADGYPVMFWIYGGAFNEGMNWGPLNIYEGHEVVARGNVCVVATNYRLGVLGFLVTPEASGNQAIQDQRMAMQWTRDNIKNFGGNPNLVTIWGESAGAMSVSIHMVSPLSQGLFHRAIMESNVAAFRYQKKSDQAETFGARFAKITNCSSVANLTCLRALSGPSAITLGEKASENTDTNVIDRILEGGFVEDAFAMQWAPVIDTPDLPDEPLNLFAAGKFAKVPVIVGTNQDEGATFVYAGVNFWLPEYLYPLAMDAIFEKDGPKVVNYYKNVSQAWNDTRDSLSYVLTDFWFKCSAEAIANYVSNAGLPTYVYRFNHIVSFPAIFPTFGLPAVCENRTCHATELPFVFHNYANYSITEDEQSMSDDFAVYWTSFATAADPNAQGPSGKGTILWPLYNETARLNLRFSTPSRAVESTQSVQQGALPTNGVCAFFDRDIGYNH